ncbi:putative quinol monooxygenase [Salegentibacter chungangensis]|uniref:Quinol monooxygenase n=1 Tax=Salegentibacter chungangensis TaxID=1335724 RepID=A0ABW3NP87_9FLAO
MKTRTKLQQLFPVLIFFLLFSCDEEKREARAVTDNAIILVEYQSLPDKADKAMSEITKLVEKARQEPHFVKITIHRNPKDPTKIFLYEEWDNEAYFRTTHMETSHIKEFIESSQNFLSGPPKISYWRVKKRLRAEEKME